MYKRGERLNRIRKKKEKSKKKKDYGRLRSDNDNEKIMQNSEEWKRKVK